MLSLKTPLLPFKCAMPQDQAAPDVDQQASWPDLHVRPELPLLAMLVVLWRCTAQESWNFEAAGGSTLTLRDDAEVEAGLAWVQGVLCDLDAPTQRLTVTTPAGVALVAEVRKENSGMTVALRSSPPQVPSLLAAQWLGWWREASSNLALRTAPRLGDLPWIDGATFERLRQAIVPGKTMPVPRGTVLDLLDHWAEADPGRLAAVEGLCSLDWAALKRRSDAVAHALAVHGLARQTAVAVLMPQGLDWYCVLLGILRAGMVYVPLSRRNPASRQAYILHNSGVQVAVTDTPDALAHALSPSAVLKPEALLTGPAGGPFVSGMAPSPDDLAYVIYTSGSTGEPKGVMTSHANLRHFVEATGALFPMVPLPRTLQFAEASFDMSIQDLFYPFLRGGCLVLRPRDTVFDFDELARYVAEHRVNALALPTAVWHEWYDRIALGCLPIPACVDVAIVGGELMRTACFTTDNLSPHTRLYHAYGPTEATVYSTAMLYGDAQADAAGRIPIGRPMPNTEVFIVDARDDLVPPGVVGELLIAGPCLSPGYHARDDLTRQRFVSWRDGTAPGAPVRRVYRTGDLGYWYGDGQIMWVGRTDGQIKIRGMRVELGEIEACLTRCIHVRHAAVRVCGEGGDKHLAAVIELGEADSPASALDHLRTHVSAQLPRYMVPQQIALVTSMPMNASGKIDRAAIAQLPLSPWLRTSDESVVADGAMQALVLDMWTRLFPHGTRPGLDDDFLADDVSSLKLALYFAELLDAVGCDVPISAFADTATLREVAAQLEQAAAAMAQLPA